MYPTRALVGNAVRVSLIAMPGGILVWWLALRPRVGGAPATIARCVFFASVALLVTIWTVSGAVSFEPRHLASAAFGLLPLALAEGRERWRSGRRIERSLLTSAALFYVVLPLSYGVVAVPQPRPWSRTRSAQGDYVMWTSDLKDTR